MRHLVKKNVNGHTDGQPDRQPKNMIPPPPMEALKCAILQQAISPPLLVLVHTRGGWLLAAVLDAVDISNNPADCCCCLCCC